MSATEYVIPVAAAKQIIVLAREHGVFSGAPEREDQILQCADDLIRAAEAAERAGIRNDAVIAVLRVARDGSWWDDPPFDPDPVSPGPTVQAGHEPGSEPGDEHRSEPESTVDPNQLSFDIDMMKAGSQNEAFSSVSSEPVPEPPASVAMPQPSEAIEAERPLGRVSKENFPLPPEINGEPPQLPRDLSALDDIALRKLHAEYHACLSRTIWVLAISEGDYSDAQFLFDHRLGLVMRDLEDANPKRPVTSIKTEAMGHPDLTELHKDCRRLASEVRQLKALRDIYEATCSRASREMTFRLGERESSGGLRAR